MKYWTCQFFVIFPNFCPLKERRKFSKLFGLPICGFWVVVPWKLAPKWMKLENEWNSNSIHLLYRALRTNSSCYCFKLGWYHSENTSFRITISENHFVSQTCFLALIFMLCLEYPISKLYFSERSQRVHSETTIRNMRYLGQKKILMSKFEKNVWV